MTSSDGDSRMNLISENWRYAILTSKATIKDAICNLNDVGLQIVLVVDDNKLIGTLSDGDVRRGLLKGLQLNSQIDSIISRSPVVVPEHLPGDLVKQLMVVNKIRQIPIVDNESKLLGLYTWDKVEQTSARNNLMVIMAGGRGSRMNHHTDDCPKPMLRIAGKPMLEHIIERAKSEGFSEFIISLHYLGHLIQEYFKDGSHLGVDIKYLGEEVPMGTAGALSLMEAPSERPFLITNGDVITDIRYGELLDFHERHSAVATMAVRPYEWQHPFGVVKMQGMKIASIEEKPVTRTHVNAGIYVLSPEALKYLSMGESLDMPMFFERLIRAGCETIAFPMHEPWMDVGRPTDLELANANFGN